MDTSRAQWRSEVAAARWYRDRDAQCLIGFRYIPWLASLNLVWEIAQLPLYTLWEHATPAYIAFAVSHCTAGDVLIGTLALVLALIATNARAPARWPRGRIMLITVLIAVAYTAFSEWMNTAALGNWEYSPLMPRVVVGGIEIGISPVIQWLLIPPIALTLALYRSGK
jgi:hypothetical protein